MLSRGDCVHLPQRQARTQTPHSAWQTALAVSASHPWRWRSAGPYSSDTPVSDLRGLSRIRRRLQHLGMNLPVASFTTADLRFCQQAGSACAPAIAAEQMMCVSVLAMASENMHLGAGTLSADVFLQ